MTWTRQNNNWKKAYNKLAEDYFDLQHEYDQLKLGVVTYDPADGVPVVSKSCCGQTTFIADSKGVIDRPIPGTYNITLIIKEDNKENV